MVSTNISINQHRFQDFSRFVGENIESITPMTFSNEFGKLEWSFIHYNEVDNFCNASIDLVTNVIEKNRSDLAGIIISGLCKIVDLPATQLEKIAKKGYYVAKKNDDPIHMMSRLEDLRRVLVGKKDRFYDYLHTLFKEEKCLERIVNDYDDLKDNRRTVLRELKPIESYQKMLAHVQVDIAKVTKKKEPENATKRLLEAREVFEKFKNKQTVEYIDMLLREISQTKMDIFA